ncbi:MULTISPECIES: uroporphyrinogen-III synthase [Variovorax]|jgi:uroporphyrinogen-III synthase|uniref:uroporphyrinogen-III synthase n=1 Tax=Variovorax TaxID=34072 RepID=UPI00086F79AE|nr:MULTISPECIES: uroporphyrinogen-III synthase [Variovorax]MBN8757034.1 uroporphyrinogen-III synthase [Variovorax sp.]ODU13823.1 MAG: uroporphyrinogen III synthase [Variovorax sp. SCN 67-85]ODV21115.1 MAG: uroporphyrinogen III synthase [Variovorax sp. SCN 67-20]OJZ08415.1 MAG: uroporphyrinogen III synthase [Variovorax sp. 67-131]UKI10205.1 uroporphyrinogen-III synthase [Variovorax paradoxus]
MTARPVIVTRPEREAAQWVSELRAAGLDAVALPLIVIAPVADAQPLRAAWQRLGSYAALMFVSATAVEHFFQHEAPGMTAGRRFWATGPGTTRALLRSGVPPEQIDAPPPEATRFDSEALWERVQGQVTAGVRVLIVRGGDDSGQPAGRDWLAREIDAAGGLRDTVVAYRRLPPSLDVVQLRIATDGAQGRAIWLFSSSEAIGNLQRAMPGTDWHAASAVATHARIGEAARAAGFGALRVCTPLQDALIASIESLA